MLLIRIRAIVLLGISAFLLHATLVLGDFVTSQGLYTVGSIIGQLKPQTWILLVMASNAAAAGISLAAWVGKEVTKKNPLRHTICKLFLKYSSWLIVASYLWVILLLKFIGGPHSGTYSPPLY